MLPVRGMVVLTLDASGSVVLSHEARTSAAVSARERNFMNKLCSGECGSQK
jgi:hypothetical protein